MRGESKPLGVWLAGPGPDGFGRSCLGQGRDSNSHVRMRRRRKGHEFPDEDEEEKRAGTFNSQLKMKRSRGKGHFIPTWGWGGAEGRDINSHLKMRRSREMFIWAMISLHFTFLGSSRGAEDAPAPTPCPGTETQLAPKCQHRGVSRNKETR